MKRLWKKLGRLLSGNIFASERILMDAEGFRVLRRREPESVVLWRDIAEIRALKTDAVGAPIPWVTVRLRGGETVHIWPEAHGYHEFVKTLPQYLEGVRDDWYEEIMAGPDFHSECDVYRSPRR